MRIGNVPALDARYWAAIICASLLGTTFGDYISGSLGLGFAGALVPLGIMLGGIFIAERTTKWASVYYYWAAIVLTRTAATNLGDFLARPLHLGYGPVSAVVIVAMAVILVAFRFRSVKSGAPDPFASTALKVLPKTDTRYWVGILMVSTFGTTFGDFVADDLGFGLAKGSLVMGAVLATALLGELIFKRSNEVRYWMVLAVIRTTGTVMGDWLSSDEGLNLGFGWAAGLVGAVLVTVLLIPSRAPAAQGALGAMETEL